MLLGLVLLLSPAGLALTGVHTWLCLATNATAGTAQIFHSTNGLLWTLKHSRGIVWRSVTYAQPLETILAVGEGESGGPHAVRSSDRGNTWSDVTTFPASHFGRAVSWGKNVFVSVGNGTAGSIVASTDGANWVVASNVMVQGFGVAYDGNWTWLAVGRGGASIMRSLDGLSWSTVLAELQPPFDGNNGGGRGVAYGLNRWVVAGEGTAAALAYSDTDGITWVAAAFPAFTSGVSVAFGNGRFVAVGRGGDTTVAYSDDGIGFTALNGPPTTAMAAAYGNNLWLAVGLGPGAFRIASSSTGNVPFNALANFFEQGYGIYYAFVTSLVSTSFGGGTVTTQAATSTSAAPSTWASTSTAGTTTLTSTGTTAATTTAATPTTSTANPSPTTTSLTTSTASPSAATTTTSPTTSTANPTTPPSSSPCSFLPNCTCSLSACTSTVSVVVSGAITVSSNLTLSVLGSLTLSSTATFVANVTALLPSVPLTASTSGVTVSGSLQLVFGAIPSGVVTVVRGSSVAGTFSSVVASSSSACSAVTSALPTYGATTITVAFETVNTCSSSSGLPPGAYAGIGVGAAALAVLVTLMVVWLWRRARAARDATENDALRMVDLEALQRSKQ